MKILPVRLRDFYLLNSVELSVDFYLLELLGLVCFLEVCAAK